ncbi:MAG: hypothetical protein KF725_10545 [Cyclobacteriaceae bacterium]|nr:hypothetical protein [Cyclobacteriaceae bacterium]UYN86148.1 MAG: hypothetical protein KIT51_14940 [Cyclobacteriaceae bacterium]
MLLLLPALLVTCTVEEEQTIDPVKPPETVNKKNPYSVENVTQAFENLVARSGGRIKIAVPSTTHNYVQFQPQNLDQVMLLQDLGYDLWDEPLDQHIEYAGDYYQHPGLPDSLNYFYTLIPENYSITQNVPTPYFRRLFCLMTTQVTNRILRMTRGYPTRRIAPIHITQIAHVMKGLVPVLLVKEWLTFGKTW